MYVIDQPSPENTPIEGIRHATWAGADQGLKQISLWRQSLEPGAATPPHRHECDEVVLCQSGWGELHIEGEVHRFGAGSTVVLPQGRVHQLFSVGPMPLEILGVFPNTPVQAFLPDGQAIELPWRS